MLNIFIDIETIPDERQNVRDYFTASVRPPGTIKKVETIAAWEANERPAAETDAIAALALNPWFAHVLCVCVGTDDSNIIARFCMPSERETLAAFAAYVGELTSNNRYCRFVGHNILWDLRVIAARCVVNGPSVPRIPYNVKPWSDNIFDTANFLNDKPISMDKLCLALGIEGKGDFCGADVWAAYKRGDIAKIVDYCVDDVARTKQLFVRLTGSAMINR